MKKILVISNYVPKEGFNYPGGLCPLTHRRKAHEALFSMQRFFDEKIFWKIIKVEKYDYFKLKSLCFDTQYDAIFCSGSPYNTDDNYFWIKNLKKVLTDFHESEIKTPLLGLCFGAQILAEVFGGTVSKADDFFTGETSLTLTTESYAETIIETRTFHENYIKEMPPKAKLIGHGPQKMPYLIQFDTHIWGIQSHPEFILSEKKSNKASNNFWRSFFQKHFF